MGEYWCDLNMLAQANAYEFYHKLLKPSDCTGTCDNILYHTLPTKAHYPTRQVNAMSQEMLVRMRMNPCCLSLHNRSKSVNDYMEIQTAFSRKQNPFFMNILNHFWNIVLNMVTAGSFELDIYDRVFCNNWKSYEGISYFRLICPPGMTGINVQIIIYSCDEVNRQ